MHVLRLGADAADGVIVVVVEMRSEDRLGGHRPNRRHRIHDEVVEGRRLRADVDLGLIRRVHQSRYLGVGGAGAGPSTVNHLRYKVFHVPSRRIRSKVPLTKRTIPVFSRLIPMP